MRRPAWRLRLPAVMAARLRRFR